jgi:hypothetical protein
LRDYKERMSGNPCIAAEAAAHCIIYTYEHSREQTEWMSGWVCWGCSVAGRCAGVLSSEVQISVQLDLSITKNKNSVDVKITFQNSPKDYDAISKFWN